MLFRSSLISVCILALLGFAATAGENLLSQGDFGVGDAGKWELNKDWMDKNFNVKGDGAAAYLQIDDQASATTTMNLPDGLKKVELALRARQINFAKGEKGWDIPSVSIVKWIKADGSKMDAPGWKKTIKLRGEGGGVWVIHKEKYDIPADVKKAVVKIKYEGSGTLDIDWVQAYDPSSPPEMKEDAE